MASEWWSAWAAVRERRPLVQCITNFVSMDIMANALLAAGASPAMVHSETEAAEFAGLASGLLVNVGTLSPQWVSGMQLAAAAARGAGTPWALDPVACGVTTFRTKTIVELLDLKPTLVRGNASEVAALAAAAGVAAPVGAGRGVDSNLGSADAALGAAKALASHLGCVVAVTGPEDLVTDGARTARVANGVPLLSAITATGCSVTALCLASVAANKGGDVLVAVAAALAAFGVAAERGAATARGPASLRVALLDELYALEEEGFEAGAKVAWEGGS